MSSSLGARLVRACIASVRQGHNRSSRHNCASGLLSEWVHTGCCANSTNAPPKVAAEKPFGGRQTGSPWRSCAALLAVLSTAQVRRTDLHSPTDIHLSCHTSFYGTFQSPSGAYRGGRRRLPPARVISANTRRACSSSRACREFQVMQSSGGLTTHRMRLRHAALTVLSGPAGGVGGRGVGGGAGGVRDVLCFDMGGTSCDVCAIDGGRVAETAQRSVAGRALALPALDIHTVGAGGGSIAWRDGGGALRVGPRSAGAEPGPACYGLGGTSATVTDANMVLGRLLDDAPLAGGVCLDRAAAERAVENWQTSWSSIRSPVPRGWCELPRRR